MMKIYNDICELIGRTPLLRLSNIAKDCRICDELIGKVERFNPTGSAKDRAAYYMITDAEERGLISPGATLVEPTSGNTGIGLAAIAAVRGYKVILTMPDTMSVERIKLLEAYGAEIVLTPGSLGMDGAVARAHAILDSTPGSFMPSQFDNPANPESHVRTTGPEIWQDTDGKVDVLVAGIGSGGTLCGAGRYLKGMNPKIKVVAVEPEESPVISEGRSGSHGIQGIGANFVPGNYDRAIVDEVIAVPTSDALSFGAALCRREGLLCGISSGAAVAGAVRYSKCQGTGLRIVVILPDTGERYLSTGMFG